MTHILFEPVRSRPTVLFRTEHVERKGLGHPDTICDSIMEAASNLLCRHYLEACGRVLHHNVDKGLLVAGESSPRLAGGEVNVPLRLIFGDRATDEVNGKKIPAEGMSCLKVPAITQRRLCQVDCCRAVTHGSLETLLVIEDLCHLETMAYTVTISICLHSTGISICTPVPQRRNCWLPSTATCLKRRN